MGTGVDPDFRELYEAEARAVFATVYLLCRDRALAEDATQEAFARALERWGRLRGKPWAAGWVATTALNVAKRWLRRNRLPEPRQEERGADTEILLDLWREVGVLPHRQREALVLCYRMDLPVREVASLMGCREGTVRTHLARGLATLRTRLGGEIDAGR